jgi:CheY-like chemotaxis protein
VGILEKLGYHADAVGDGAEALEALARAAYAAVLMDGQMPGMDGFAATAEIRRREGPDRHTPIIAMTAHAMRRERESYLAAGMDDYVAKPVRLEDLEAALRRWVLDPTPRADAAAVVPEPAPAAPPVAGPIDQTAWERLRRLQQPGQPDVVVKYVRLFLELTPQRLEALRAALAQGSRGEVQTIAHTLKGEAQVIGAGEMHALSARLEQVARTCTPREAEEIVEGLQRAFAAARNALEPWGAECVS